MTGKRPSQARHIVDVVLGGRVRASEITGYPLTRIDSFLRTGWVQGKYHVTILTKAWEAGVNMNQLDFVAHLAGLSPPAREPERPAG